MTNDTTTTRQIEAALDEQFLSWEQGQGASPSPWDAVVVAAQLLNVELDPAYGIELAHRLFDYQCEGATLGEQAEWLTRNVR